MNSATNPNYQPEGEVVNEIDIFIKEEPSDDVQDKPEYEDSESNKRKEQEGGFHYKLPNRPIKTEVIDTEDNCTSNNTWTIRANDYETLATLECKIEENNDSNQEDGPEDVDLRTDDLRNEESRQTYLKEINSEVSTGTVLNDMKIIELDNIDTNLESNKPKEEEGGLHNELLNRSIKTEVIDTEDNCTSNNTWTIRANDYETLATLECKIEENDDSNQENGPEDVDLRTDDLRDEESRQTSLTEINTQVSTGTVLNDITVIELDNMDTNLESYKPKEQEGGLHNELLNRPIKTEVIDTEDNCTSNNTWTIRANDYETLATLECKIEETEDSSQEDEPEDLDLRTDDLRDEEWERIREKEEQTSLKEINSEVSTGTVLNDMKIIALDNINTSGHALPECTETSSKQEEVKSEQTVNSVKKNQNKILTKMKKISNKSVKKSYKCNVCEKVFKKKCELKIHIRVHTNEKPYRCDVCNKCFRQKINLITHSRTHTGERPYKCVICDKSFICKGHLTAHIRIHTGEKPFTCNLCDERFNYKSDLKNHSRIHSKEKPYKCYVCGKCFSQRNNLNRHIINHTSEKPYKCEVCNKFYKLKINLKAHMLIHTGEKPYECDVCKKRFIHKAHYNAHILTHSMEKLFKCTQCDKGFNYKISLDNHMRTHTGEKPYKCYTCGKCFSVRNNYNKHIRIHSGVNLHRCDICDKGFNVKNNLMRHIRIHTGEKPYKCTTCNKCFKSKITLDKHIQSHTKEKPFKCDVCEKSFVLKSHFNTHIRIHTGEKPYKCEICKKCYNQKYNLKRHTCTQQ